jgi:hypothetical protein
MLDHDVALEIVYANSDEQNQIVMAELRAGNLDLLFADSATLDDQENFLASNADVASTVLIAPRRVVSEFSDAASPQMAIWFGGSGTRDKPTADWLSAFASATILRTEERGNIELIVDGSGLVVRTAQ